MKIVSGNYIQIPNLLYSRYLEKVRQKWLVSPCHIIGGRVKTLFFSNKKKTDYIDKFMMSDQN